LRAIVITRPGGPEVLDLVNRPDPEPSRGEVRVRVKAAAVNRADLEQRRGRYPAPPGSPPDVPGLEFSGEIEELGADVTQWNVGDRVFGLVGGGGYADALVTHERLLARVPDGMSFVDAAAAPEAFITAYDAMFTQAELAMGEWVLIHAVGSGVGTAAAQLARVAGARSIGTARTASKLERARGLGLDHGITTSEASFADEVLRITGGSGVAVVLELVGGDYVREDLGCVARGGRIILVGLLGGTEVRMDLGRLLVRRVVLRGTMLRSRPLEQKIAATDTFARSVVPLLAAGRLKAVVDDVLPLADARLAHTRLEEGGTFGKLVLDCRRPWEVPDGG